MSTKIAGGDESTQRCVWAHGVDGGDGAHACVFIVLRKKRQRSGERHEGVAEVTVWVCGGREGCDGRTCLQIRLLLGEIQVRRDAGAAGSTRARAVAATACGIAGPP